jgi:hypothetical protein
MTVPTYDASKRTILILALTTIVPAAVAIEGVYLLVRAFLPG